MALPLRPGYFVPQVSANPYVQLCGHIFIVCFAAAKLTKIAEIPKEIWPIPKNGLPLSQRLKPMTADTKEIINRSKVWRWLPTLYFAEAVPYAVINVLTVLMYTRMDIDLEMMTFWTGLLYLPWVIKPLWSPFVDVFSTKRRWVLHMQNFMAVSFLLVALLISSSMFFVSTIIIFFVAAFLSATHDIAADGYYMLGLSDHEQAEYVGWRSTFYRLGNIFVSGALIYMAGYLEEYSAGSGGQISIGDISFAWQTVMLVVAVIMGGLAIYHRFRMPKASLDRPRGEHNVRQVLTDLGQTFATFFTKKGVWCALLFMLLYRLPEALCIKIVSPFLVGDRAAGGLAMSTKDVGIANGVTGVVALLLGGILGGYLIARGGLKKWLWPMALSLTLPCALYTLLAVLMPQTDTLGLLFINACIFVEQFGYGFGFTAFMLYLIYFSEGKWKTSHYAFCTGFMALGMMLPGMFSGLLFNLISDINLFGFAGPQGYINYFTLVVICSVFTCIACLLVKIDPGFGKKTVKK